nr:unnamed protein product [Callosobruchus chinensis]
MQNLKCSICHHYLSVPPVSCTKGKYTCGRCCPTTETCGPYEEIARHILFPCSNEGCKTKLKWGEAMTHEDACTFRRIKCPSIACSMRIRLNEVLSHFTASHKGFIHDHQCRMLLKFNRVLYEMATHCFSYRKTRFLVFVKITTDWPMHTFSFNVAALPNGALNKSLNDMNYTISLYLNSTPGNCILKKVGKHISQYDEDKHCLYCITGKCNKSGHHTDTFWEVEFKNINSKHYFGNIRCIVKMETFISVTERLECPVCKNYMNTTIFICPTGHSLCKQCRESIKTCPLCNCTIGTTRNYTLEDIAETLEVPCHNKCNGCQFVGQVAETIQHESLCWFGGKSETTNPSEVHCN